MSEYLLSRRAESNLLEIYEFTERRFGAYQSKAYFTGLVRTFGLLADFPRIGTSAEELAKGLRRFRFQSHHIFYAEETTHVLIRGLVHVSMKLRADLFE